MKLVVDTMNEVRGTELSHRGFSAIRKWVVLIP